MLNHYLQGGKIVLLGSCALVDPITGGKTPTDATSVVFRRVTPDGALTNYPFPGNPAVAKIATGLYACAVPISQAGREKWRFESEGSCQCAAEDAFEVDKSMVV